MVWCHQNLLTLKKFLRYLQVVLDGLSNMLKMAGENADQVANMIEECGGIDKIEALQSHEKVEIYKMAYDIIEQYFAGEVNVVITFFYSRLLVISVKIAYTGYTCIIMCCVRQEEDASLAPAAAESGFTFEAGGAAPHEGFRF